MLANPILLQMKWARVVGIFAEENKITTSAALDFFYHSDLYPIISKGISDLHCESDLYLAQLLSEEWEEKVCKKNQC